MFGSKARKNLGWDPSNEEEAIQAIRENPDNIVNIPRQYQTEKLCIELVRESPDHMASISEENRTSAVCKAAYEEDRSTTRYMNIDQQIECYETDRPRLAKKLRKTIEETPTTTETTIWPRGRYESESLSEYDDSPNESSNIRESKEPKRKWWELY